MTWPSSMTQQQRKQFWVDRLADLIGTIIIIAIVWWAVG